MNAPKFTPGPWIVFEEVAIDYRPCRIYGAEGGSQIAWLAGGGRKRAIDKPEERANARLIAAAPELYWALESLIHAVEATHWPLTAEQMEPLNTARAALAKAVRP